MLPNGRGFQQVWFGYIRVKTMILWGRLAWLCFVWVEKLDSDSVNLGSNPGPPATNSQNTASYRLVIALPTIAGIAASFPRVSLLLIQWPSSRDGKRHESGRQRPPGLRRRFWGERMWSIPHGFGGSSGGETEEKPLLFPIVR